MSIGDGWLRVILWSNKCGHSSAHTSQRGFHYISQTLKVLVCIIIVQRADA